MSFTHGKSNATIRLGCFALVRCQNQKCARKPLNGVKLLPQVGREKASHPQSVTRILFSGPHWSGARPAALQESGFIPNGALENCRCVLFLPPRSV